MTARFAVAQIQFGRGERSLLKTGTAPPREAVPRGAADWHGQEAVHNVAFMDGHVKFVRIRKGLHVTPEYSVIPFAGLLHDANECQEEENR